MMEFDSLYESYVKLVKVKGYKTGCGNMYPKAVSELFDFLKQKGYSSFEITAEDMASYYHVLTTRKRRYGEGTLADNTINHHLFAIKILFDYLLESKLVTALPVLPKYHRNKKAPLEILTVDEIKSLYAVCESHFETALLSVAYGCGLRRSKIIDIQLGDIDLARGYLIIRSGKGGKRREVPISKKVVTDIREYIHTERTLNNSKSHALFLNSWGNGMSGDKMNKRIKSIISRIPELEEKRVTLHTFRRSIATHLIENGASVHFVKEFLGHSEIDTTQLYAIRRRRNKKII